MFHHHVLQIGELVMRGVDVGEGAFALLRLFGQFQHAPVTEEVASCRGDGPSGGRGIGRREGHDLLGGRGD